MNLENVEVEDLQNSLQIMFFFLGPIDVGSFSFFDHACCNQILDRRFSLKHHISKAFEKEV